MKKINHINYFIGLSLAIAAFVSCKKEFSGKTAIEFSG